jgi:succinoglycan biosynthesis transport protein ExoP
MMPEPAPRGPRATSGPSPDGAEPDAPGSTVRLDELVALLRRHIWLVAGVAAAAVAAAGLVGHVMGPVYRAVAVIRLSDPRRAFTGGVVEDPARTADGAYADPLLSLVELLKSRAVAGAVVDSMPLLRLVPRNFSPTLLADVAIAPDAAAESLHVTFDRDSFVVANPSGGEPRGAAYGAALDAGSVRFTVLHRPGARHGLLRVLSRDAAVSRLLDDLRVKPRLRTDIVDVAYTAPDPARAQEVANRVVDVFRAASADAAQQQSRLRREFLESQLKVNDSLLADARQALTAFQRRTRSDGTEESPGRERTELPGLELQRQQLLAERRTDEDLLAALRDSSTSRKAAQTALATPDVAASPAVVQLNAQLFQYEKARDSLASLSASHPDLPRLNQLISSTEAKLLRAVQAGVQGAMAALDGRIAAINDLRARRVGSLQHDAEEARLTERVDNARKVADELRLEYEKAKIAEAVTAGQVEIVDHAARPVKPAGVGLAQLLGLGLFVGLVLGAAGAVVADRLGKSISQRVQVEHLGMPVLGVVPHSGGGADGKGPHSADAVVEAFRGVRLNLLNAYGAGRPVAVAVSSPGSGDGKSFVSSNLALAFAYAGHRTLLIDADLRRGGLHRTLSLKREPGLTDLLLGNLAPEQVVQATAYPSLDFLASGSRRRDAPELMGSPRMAELVAGLRSRYGVIVVDTPPLGAGVDAFLLATLAGSLLMVLRLGSTDRRLAEAKLELVRSVPARLLGTVLNDVRDGSEYGAYAYYMDGYDLTKEPLFRPLVARKD